MPFAPTHLIKATLVASAILLLGTPQAWADSNTATVRQAGTANSAFIEQVAGNGNEAHVSQGRDSIGGHAAIYQRGDGNRAGISQDSGRANFALIKTLGDRNGSPSTDAIAQTGSYNTALTVTAGNDNIFSVVQASAGAPNLAAQLQVGDGNFAAASQSNDFGSEPSPSGFVSMARTMPVDAPGAAAGLLELHAMALPILAANASLQIQVGNDNQATATQTGSSNLVIQKQIGNRNTMSAEQTGSFNFLTHIQIGNDIASPTVSQTGGAAAVIVQSR